MRLNKAKCKVLSLDQVNSQYQYSLEGEGIEISPTEKDFRTLVDEKVPMSQHGHSSQQYPGLHPKQCVQQVKGVDSVPLLHCHEIAPGVLHPALGCSTQQRNGPLGMGPEESD